MQQHPTLIEMMRHLIGSPSVSSVSPEWDKSNAQVIDHLAGWCETLGFHVEHLPIAGHPGKFNLVASAGSGPDGLVLSGHTDTVPYDEARWSSDPFGLTERDNRWYGLGTCDMKGFFAVALEAIRDFDLSKLTHPLILVATADEESSMCGAKALLDTHRRLGRHAVIGEPTGMRPIRLHKGIGMEAIRLTGRSGHSSDPALGVNALDGMYLAMAELISWRSELQQRYRNPLFAVDVPTINLGHIHGGDNPNRICAHCELHFDIRPLPGMDLAELRGEIDRRIGARLRDSGLQFERVSLFEGIPAMDTPAESPIVKAAEALTGVAAGAVAFGTEGPYLNALGMQTVIMGPGSIEQAHQPDEYLALDQIEPAKRILRELISRFCMT
ncbi:MAG: acetylornithine deacetylase [Chromatiaceae bacterium]|nr:acetylornithine deacetylase [Gammaproteobacteria bacterium]MCP5318773.1 acetylornithine deacetylase [Chromatiaceae bacterium]MCW5587761.1 acetylornithine deacetylase [Chromatiales bacterium]MCP5435538.1 acetylornithine deacetylase [Chromatiaceae bacterium]HOP15987.1 acetylornithine deacetylase [Gammaproteobacteria bacterium]